MVASFGAPSAGAGFIGGGCACAGSIMLASPSCTSGSLCMPIFVIVSLLAAPWSGGILSGENSSMPCMVPSRFLMT